VRRTESFRAAARGLGLPEVPVVMVPAPTTLRSGRKALDELLLRGSDIDAVFCSSDLLALGVLTEARVRALAVPERLAVIGFGDLAFAADLEPALSTVHIKGAAIGRQAARFIVDRVEGREVAERVVDIGFSIVERASG
jgi:LacI family gluconate utilization system Gnt-I transcriptional repressor